MKVSVAYILRHHWRRILSLTLVTALGVGLYIAPWQQWQDEGGEALVALTAEQGMRLEKIKVEGIERTDLSAVYDHMGVEKGDPMVRVDVALVKENVEALPWVKTARVSRLLPDKLEIQIVEREPFAIWQLDGKHWLIDETGVTITDENLEEFYGLPFVVGKGAPEATARLYNVITLAPELSARMTSATRVGERRWDIDFDSGLRLRLPEENADYGPAEAWQQFVTMNAKDRIIDREIAIFDMRLKDRVVVKITDEAAEILKQREEDKKKSKT